jgi:hypothetical protein
MPRQSPALVEPATDLRDGVAPIALNGAYQDAPADPAQDDTLDTTDLLRGIAQFAKFIDENERRTTYLLETKQIPAGKLGQYWIGSKTVVREHYAKLVRGGAVKSSKAA